ncbi:11053_t:CDS:2, partial [Cetraspora pellucida]
EISCRYYGVGEMCWWVNNFRGIERQPFDGHFRLSFADFLRVDNFADIAKGIWYKLLGMGMNKLKIMLQQIAINTDINLDGNCSSTEDQHLSSIALLIPYTAFNEDLESYYTFLGDSYNYVNYESYENKGTIVLL